MEKRKLDYSPYAAEGEQVVLKTRAKAGSGIFVELAVCFTLWLLTLAGDCFLIGAAYVLKNQIKVTAYYLIVFGIGVAVHIVPFAAWLASALKRYRDKSDKWFALTDKRIAIINDGKPATVTYIFLSDVTAMSHDANTITLYSGEDKIKIKQIENLEQFAQKIEDLVFADMNLENEKTD